MIIMEKYEVPNSNLSSACLFCSHLLKLQMSHRRQIFNNHSFMQQATHRKTTHTHSILIESSNK